MPFSNLKRMLYLMVSADGCLGISTAPQVRISVTGEETSPMVIKPWRLQNSGSRVWGVLLTPAMHPEACTPPKTIRTLKTKSWKRWFLVETKKQKSKAPWPVVDIDLEWNFMAHLVFWYHIMYILLQDFFDLRVRPFNFKRDNDGSSVAFLFR